MKKINENMYVCDDSENKIVTKAYVYNLQNAIEGSKYPMSVDIDSLNGNVTKTCIKLAQTDKGEGHDNWLNGCLVSFDLSFTKQAWGEAERYHFLDFISSQSTMHCITKFELKKQFNKHVDKRLIDVLQEKIDIYNEDPTEEHYLDVIYNNAAGFIVTAKMVTNYRQLKTIYSQRLFHKLPEWREFCHWIETLPYSELITGNKGDNTND